jgi:uncharacterized iron-regulated membrane protein
MASIRTVLFWFHLAAGITAGGVVLIMSATGVALTYEKQVLEWADRGAWSAPPSSGAARLSPETLLARVRETQPEAAPTTLTLHADAAAPATVTMAGQRALLVDPYTGDVIGPPPSRLRSFFRAMTSWHRWLAAGGEGRATGKAITGAANLAFLFLVVSGIYIWVPRLWSRTQFRNVLWFRRGVQGRARDFNWHNVIGIWSAVPLALVVLGAVPISYPWANNLVYRLVGEEPPAPAQARPAGPPENAGRDGIQGQARQQDAAAPIAAPDFTGIDRAYAVALEQSPEWRAVSIRIPNAAQRSVSLTIDKGYGGQPQKRGTLTVTRAGDVERWETFADLSAGRRLRSWLRFVHTGEYYGLTGQTIAGLVSAGGVGLVWTGLALAVRRFANWLANRSRQRGAAPTRKAA